MDHISQGNDEFLSTPSARRATVDLSGVANMTGIFLSTPSARRANDHGRVKPFLVDISIHALREEGDETIADLLLMFGKFLSTPSARRATYEIVNIKKEQIYFYPRPPRGGRRMTALLKACMEKISIHALREEGDFAALLVSVLLVHFYPRPPRGGRPKIVVQDNIRNHISIHALREEGDPKACRFLNCQSNFYPRPPRGGRLLHGRSIVQRGQSFLSTPSARRATFFDHFLTLYQINFYPRPPRGGRRIF